MWVAAVDAGKMDNVLASGLVKASTQTVGLSEHFGECHCASSSMKKRTNKGTAPAKHFQMNRLSILCANKYVAESNDAVHQIHSYNLIKTENEEKKLILQCPSFFC